MITARDSVNEPIPLDIIKFSGGELQVKFNKARGRVAKGILRLRADLYSSDAVMALLMTVDAWRRFAGDNTVIRVECPYLPYARQDRVCAEGEAFSVTVMCKLLNSLKLDSLTIWDPHSAVTPALLERLTVIEQHEFVGKALQLPLFAAMSPVLVAPDVGAEKKTRFAADKHKLPMIQAMKYRNPETGALSGFRVLEEVPEFNGRPLLLVDDICDGGRTFIELAKALKKIYPQSPLYLYVTHGIFSQGLAPLAEHFVKVICPNPWPGHQTALLEHLR